MILDKQTSQEHSKKRCGDCEADVSIARGKGKPQVTACLYWAIRQELLKPFWKTGTVAADEVLCGRATYLPEAKCLDFFFLFEPLSPTSCDLFGTSVIYLALIHPATLHLGQHSVSVNLLLTDTQYLVTDMQITEMVVMS